MTLLRITLAAVLVSFVMAPNAYAAQLRLVHNTGTQNVSVMLDTEGETINAIQGTIDVTGGAANVLLGETIIPLWLTRPSAESLTFAGVIPGGFTGAGGILFKIVPKQTGTITLAPKDIKAYLNDGNGTAAQVTSTEFTAQIPSAGGLLLTPADNELPDFSEVRIARDPAIFEGKWFVVFNAQDAGTGVSRYEVAERAGADTENVENLVWRAAESPEKLQDQSRRSTVFVRAFDGSGNARIKAIAPLNEQTSNPYAVLGGSALLLLVLAAVVIFKRARIKK